MRKSTVLGFAALLAGCSGATPEGSEQVAAPRSPAAPEIGTHGPILSYFEGTVDAAHGTMSMTYRAPGGEIGTESAGIPSSGSGPTAPEGGAFVVMHTTSAAFGGACGANTVCGNVEAISGLSVPGTFYAYIDSIAGTGVVSNGPWQYLNLAGGATSATQSWSFSEPGPVNFSFKGHVEAVFQSCKVLHTVLPALGTALYEVNPGGATIPGYCDMSTFGGGWTQVYDQKVSVAPGYQPTATWAGTVSTTAPNAGQYGILNLIGSLKTTANYEFWLDWGATGYVQWTQVQNPTSIVNTLPTLVGSPNESPTGQLNDLGQPFSGMYNDNGSPGYLSADPHIGDWWWAVGTNANFNGGIPAHSEGVQIEASEARLWIR